MTRNIMALMMTAVCLLPLTACLAKPHPQKNIFTLTAATPAGPESLPAKRRTLLVGTVSVASGFDNRALIYRIGPNQIEEDFYNEFAAPPARLVADQASQFLDRASKRLRVIKTPGLVIADYGLETYLEEISGDFTQNPPQARLSIRFTMNDLRGSTARVLTERTYSGQKPLADRRPEALVAALGECLTEILAELNHDLNKAVR